MVDVVTPQVVVALVAIADEADATLSECYACNGGVTHDDDWKDGKCPICGDLRAAVANLVAAYDSRWPA